MNGALKLTPQQAACIAGRAPVTIYRALSKADLHGSKRSDKGKWWIDPLCLDSWMSGQDCPHKAKKPHKPRMV